MPTIDLPDPSLVVLVGAAGSGKTAFAARCFVPDDVLSSDAYRALLTGNEADQRVTRTAFAMLHRDVDRLLAAGRLVVVDATNVERHARRGLVARARAARVPAVAIVFALPADLVQRRNAERLGRVVDSAIVERHLARLATVLEADGLAIEGFDAVHILRTAPEVEATTVARRRSSVSRPSPS